MFQYTSLATNKVTNGVQIFGYRIPEIRYLFYAGAIVNIILSLCLLVAWNNVHGALSFKSPSSSNKLVSTSKFADMSRDNFEAYLEQSRLDFQNSSAIFNEVENAVKEKNADINPISVSYFPAYIPEGTFLYHSNNNGLIPTIYDWVAMDYEFSYDFAHFPRVNNDRRGGGPPHNGKKPSGGHGRGGKGGPPGRGNGTASLLTFAVKEPLDKLLYLGGASASKTTTGEMDTQFILSQLTDYNDFNEYIGAELICAWGNSNGRKLDGLIRLEVGFEIVICDFFDKLELVQNLTLSKTSTEIIDFPPEEQAESTDSTAVKSDAADVQDTGLAKREISAAEDLNGLRSKILDGYAAMPGYDHYASGEYVYDGDARIYLDFSKFVTILNKTYISPDTYTRRIDNITSEVNTTFLGEIDSILRGPAFDPFSTTDWEVVTHRIVKKFSPILMTLNVTLNEYLIGYDKIFDQEEQTISDVEIQIENLSTLGKNLTTWTYNLIRRYSDGHYDLHSDAQIKDMFQMWVWDYAHPYRPISSDADYLIWASITNVQTAIVERLYDIFKLGQKIVLARYVDNNETKLLDSGLHQSVVKAFEELNEFLNALDWTIFYRCTEVCGYDSICFVPTWGPSPLGWGIDDSLNTHYKGQDGISRIAKDLICFSPQTLLQVRG